MAHGQAHRSEEVVRRTPSTFSWSMFEGITSIHHELVRLHGQGAEGLTLRTAL